MGSESSWLTHVELKHWATSGVSVNEWINLESSEDFALFASLFTQFDAEQIEVLRQYLASDHLDLFKIMN